MQQTVISSISLLRLSPLCCGLADWLEKRQMPCFYRSVFGIDCPGCGMQRSFIALLRGDVAGSLSLYPALIPMIVMFAFLAVHLVHSMKHGAKILVAMFIVNVIITFTSYIYKFIS